MTSKRVFFGLIGLIALLILASGAVAQIGVGMLKKKGDELTSLKLQQEVTESRTKTLANAKRDIATYEPLEKISRSIVPQEKDQARTVREIITIAEESGVPLSNIQFPESALGEVKKKKAAKSSESSASLESSQAAAKKEKPSTVDPNTTQLTPVEGIEGLYAMEITVESDKVQYSRLLRFLELLEKNRRTAHVKTINIEPSEDDRTVVTFSIILNVYIKP